MSHTRITLFVAIGDISQGFDDVTEEPRTVFDPWQLRKDFLTWPLEDWEGFGKRVGYLGVAKISKDEFADWQRFFRKALILRAKEWETLAGEFDKRKAKTLRGPFAINLRWEGETPLGVFYCSGAFEMIGATIHLDALQGAQFRVCARPDCNNPPFRVEARHKIFCSPECAHLVAVRNSRQRAAETKSKAAKKTPNRKHRG